MARVTLSVAPWRESSISDPEDAYCFLLENVLFDGKKIPHTKANVVWDGRKDDLVGPYDFMSIWLDNIPKDIFDSLTPEQIIQGSSPARCGFPVSGLEVLVRSPDLGC